MKFSDICDTFRLCRDLAFQKRPSEEETLARFLKVFKPAVEKQAGKWGYDVSWEKPLTGPTYNAMITGVGGVVCKGKVFSNINQSSNSYLGFTVSFMDSPEDTRRVAIHIAKTSSSNTITYSWGQRSSTHKMPFPLDFCLKRPRLMEQIVDDMGLSLALSIVPNGLWESLQTQPLPKILGLTLPHASPLSGPK